MEHQSLLHAIYYLLAATIAVPIFRKWGLGAILGYLVAGAIIGPQVLGLIYETQSAMHLSELGVVMLLFVIGLELNPEQLWKMRGEVGFLGGAQLLLSALLIGAVLLWGVDLSLQQSILIGLTLALSSTAFAVPLMEEHKLMGLPLGRKGFSILLLQDLAVIPILLLLASWAPEAAVKTHIVPWWLGALTLIAVILLGPWVFNPLLKLAAKYGSREILTAAGLSIVLGVSWLMQSVGFSMSMGAFLAGILLAQSNFRHQLAADIEPFKGLLLGLFFIAVGMSLNLQLLLEHPVLVVLLALTLIAIKIAVIALVLRCRGVRVQEGALLGIMLAQGGEFAFVVLASAMEIGFVSDVIANYTILVVGLSMAFTTPIVLLYQRIIHRQTLQDKALLETHKVQETLQQLEQQGEEKVEVIVAGFGRFGQIIGRILTANNIPYNALDKNSDHIEFLKQYGVKSYFGDAARLELLEAAGIRDAKVLVVAVDEVEDSVNIVRLVRERFPHISLIVRARDRYHVYQLIKHGVKNPIREMYESSLEAARRTLLEVGFTEGQALGNINIFREHDEEMLQHAALVSDDEAALVKIVSQSRKDLKQLFTQDAEMQ